MEDIRSHIQKFYSRDQISADDLVRRYGSVRAALDAMKNIGSVRLYKVLCKYYPFEALQHILYTDDADMMEHALEHIDMQYFAFNDEDTPYIDSRLIQIENILAQIIHSGNVEAFDALAGNWIQCTSVDFPVSWILSSNIDDYILDALPIAIHIANKSPCHRRLVLQRAIHRRRQDVLMALDFNSNDDVKIYIHDLHRWNDFVDYMIGVNPEYRYDLALLALQRGYPNLVNALGFDFFDLFSSLRNRLDIAYGLIDLGRFQVVQEILSRELLSPAEHARISDELETTLVRLTPMPPPF